MVLFFTRNVKVRTCCIIVLYRLSFRIFPIISFDFHSALAIATEIVFIACLCLLKMFFTVLRQLCYTKQYFRKSDSYEKMSNEGMSLLSY